MLIIGNGILITRDPEQPFLGEGAVAVRDGIIEAVGATREIRARWPGAEFLDAGGHLIMPGLINAHHHFYSTMARGIDNDSPPPTRFSEILSGMWWRLDKVLEPEDVYWSAAVPLVEGIRNGVTTCFDHHASPRAVEGSLETIARAARDLGVRTCVCYEVSDRDGPESARAGIRENMAAIRAARDSNDNLVRAMFGLHASMTVSDATLEACVEAMGDAAAGYHFHAAEGIEDVEDSLARYGKRVVERWADWGILGEKSIAVHGIHLTDREIELLRESNTCVVHNPESNMGNAVGCAPLLTMLERGVLTGLGTDGYTFDMLESWKVGNLIHKHEQGDPNVGWAELPAMLFGNNAQIAARHFDNSPGRLRAGCCADVIVVEYRPPTPLHAGNVDSHLLFGTMGRQVRTTVIGGRIRMRDGVLVDIDEEEIYRRTRERATALWERF